MIPAGHQKVPGEHIVAHPRLVSALNHKDTRIRLVAASDAATIVVTTKGDVFALHKYRCRKVASRYVIYTLLCYVQVTVFLCY